ncbi:hypothetical protein [Myceligenerans crystallogenes]|uniref:BMP family ABC transporter substrate-binding protein n=1 Tax=Myceligenerans crystallogenes TaxID=316335 RepID=A0ABN2N3B6_9MICO
MVREKRAERSASTRRPATMGDDGVLAREVADSGEDAAVTTNRRLSRHVPGRAAGRAFGGAVAAGRAAYARRVVPLPVLTTPLAGALAMALVTTLSACSVPAPSGRAPGADGAANPAGTTPPAASRVHATVGPDFADPADRPAPESTITPAPGSWSGVRPPAGYRVVLLTGEDGPTVRAVRDAVAAWARAEDVDVERMRVTDPADELDVVVGALESAPDVVVAAGDDLTDALALATASYLDQQVLVVGSQLPEPTGNVTAVVWPGAASGRGDVPGGAAGGSAFTPERTDAAVRAGTTAVLTGWTGLVVELPG